MGSNMNFDWQTVTSLAIVVLAACYVLRHAWLTFQQPEASSCGGCAASKSCAAKNLKLVQLSAHSQKLRGAGRQ